MKAAEGRRPFGHLATDEDIAAGVRPHSILLREVRIMLRDVARELRQAPTLLGLRSSYWLLRYLVGMATTPLHSTDCVRLAGATSQSSVLVRRNQSDLYIWREVFLYKIYDFPYERLVDVETIIDLGANSGLAACYFHDRYPGAALVCVEPLSENVAVIRRQRSDRHADWIVAEKAVGVREGKATFYSSEWWSSGSMVPDIAQARQGRPNRLESSLALPPRTVPVMSMHQVLSLLEGRRANVLKIDIEGAEEALLTDPDTAWLGLVDIVIIEIHDKYVSRERILGVLSEHHFARLPHHGPCDVFVTGRLAIPHDLQRAEA